MLDIGFQELILVMVVALLVFGPDKLPDLGRRLGRAMREFRRASDEFRSTVESNLHLNEDLSLPPSSAYEPPAASPADPPGEAAVLDAVGAPGLDGATTPLPVEAGEAPGPGSLEPGGAEAAGVAADGAGPEHGVAGPFWMRRGGRLLHGRNCPWQVRVPAEERVSLEAAEEGFGQGLLSCPACAPGLSRAAEPDVRQAGIAA